MSPPSNRALLRKTLRTQLRETRRSLPAAQRIAAADALAQRLLALPMLTQTDPSTAGYAAGYWAMDGEIGLHAFQLRLPKGWIYCLPILHPDDTLRFAPWRPGDPLVTNRYGIPEPDISPDAALHADAMTLVLLPLVGFDAHCHRLGMGGGWYDRSFAFRNSQPAPPWLVGVGFAAQQTDAITHEQWDIRMDAICCENATYFREDRA
ncbi:MAG TPA: 5-formyltetrahydrofolate cyclo-ligase [Thermomonas sp.]|nr:5-formyltetrahydrofolate cyclo-ligase [Thermomonas sp.]